MTQTPTQVARPWRTTLRTLVQNVLGAILVLGIIAPLVQQIILDEAGVHLPERAQAYLAAVVAGIVIVASILTRIMAIPQVEKWLRDRRLLSGLAAEPPAADPAPRQD